VLSFGSDGILANCQEPISFADLMLSPGDNQGGVLQSAGAGRGVLWGGCRGQVNYTVRIAFGATEDPTEGICNLDIDMMTALVRLPLDPQDQKTPLYIPNLLLGHSMLSNVVQTQSDNVESVLWRRWERLKWTSFQQDDQNATTGPCFPTNFDDDTAANVTSYAGLAWATFIAMDTALRSRTMGTGMFRARVKRRLDERQGIFLIRNFSIGTPTMITEPAQIDIVADAWVQFAVRRA